MNLKAKLQYNLIAKLFNWNRNNYGTGGKHDLREKKITGKYN